MEYCAVPLAKVEEFKNITMLYSFLSSPSVREAWLREVTFLLSEKKKKKKMKNTIYQSNTKHSSLLNKIKKAFMYTLETETASYSHRD